MPPSKIRNVITIGASAGGVTPLCRLLKDIDPKIPAAIFIVLHTTRDSILDQVLRKCDSHLVSFASNEERIVPRRVYLGVPGTHLIVQQGWIRLENEPSQRWRPSIDLMFESAAVAYGPRVIGVVLSGSLWDGARGLRAIKQAEGVTIVQDPDEADYPSMPMSALQATDVDYCEPVDRIARLLNELCEDDRLGQRVRSRLTVDSGIAQLRKPARER